MHSLGIAPSALPIRPCKGITVKHPSLSLLLKTSREVAIKSLLVNQHSDCCLVCRQWPINRTSRRMESVHGALPPMQQLG